MSQAVSIIGIGMEGIHTLTEEAKEAILEADVLIGASRMLEPFGNLGKERFISYNSEEIAAYIAGSSWEHIAVLMSGDPGFFSGTRKLLPLLSAYQVSVISGISSPVYFAGRLGVHWQDMHFVSLHGMQANVVRSVASHEKTFFLLGGDVTAARICSRLCEYGLSKVKVAIGERLAMPEEKIHRGIAEEFTALDSDTLSVMLVINENYERGIRTGLSDEIFIREQVPMTKSEVRAVVMSKLAPETGDMCWDIGCGTGSVSVELALHCSQGRVFAVDKNGEAVKLTEANSRRFLCDNIELLEGDVCDVLERLPVPDVVFIGGSGGNLQSVIKAAYEKNPNARVCLTAVSLETLAEASSVFENFGKQADIIQLGVTRTKRAGSHNMLTAQNPVFIITGE